MDLQVHGFGPPADNVCRVKSNPEKQMAAMQMKKTNSAIMARKALTRSPIQPNLLKRQGGRTKPQHCS